MTQRGNCKIRLIFMKPLLQNWQGGDINLSCLKNQQLKCISHRKRNVYIKTVYKRPIFCHIFVSYEVKTNLPKTADKLAIHFTGTPTDTPQEVISAHFNSMVVSKLYPKRVIQIEGSELSSGKSPKKQPEDQIRLNICFISNF